MGTCLAGLGSALPAVPPGRRRRSAASPASRQLRSSIRARDSKITGVGTEQGNHGGSSGGGDKGGRSGGGGGAGGGGSGGGGGSSSSSGGGDDAHHVRRALALGMLKWTAAAAAAAASLAAVLPSMLSQPGVLRAALALVNSWVLPEAVSLQLDSLQAGWHRPLQLHGLRLVERCSGTTRRSGDLSAGEGAPFDPSSSSDDEDEAPPAGLAAAAEAVEAGSQRRAWRRGSSGEPEPGSGTVAAGTGSGKRRRTLVSVERISVPQTLWQLARGSPVEVVVGRPQVDCTFDATGKPRLLAVLQAAGQIPEAHAVPLLTVQAQVAHAAAPATVALAAPQLPAGGAKGGTGTAEQPRPKEQGPPPAALLTVAAAAAGGQRAAEAARSLLRDDSSDSDDEEPLPTLAQAAAAAVKQQKRGSQPAVPSVSPAALLGYMRPAAAKPRQQPQQQQAAQQEATRAGTDDEEGGSAAAGDSGAAPAQSSGKGAAPAGGAPGGGGGAAGAHASKTWLPESLQHATAAVAITGEVTAGKLRLCLSDGALLVPAEARELLGGHLHFEVLQGTAAIEQAALDDGAAQAAGGGGAGAPGDARKRVKWARQRPAVLLPWGTGMPQTPVAVRLDGQLMQFRLEGWQTARGFVYLVRPVEASMQFTPALSRYLLTALHPALGGAVGMRGATSVQARLMPHNGLLPAKQATLRVEPLAVDIAESPVLRQTIGVLGEAVSKLKFGGSVRAELSPIQATVDADGRLQAERLDMRLKTGLGPWRKELHLVSWGGASLQPPQSLDATLCVPGDALKGLGLPEFPDGAGLGLHISGSPDHPRVEVARASRDLALLLASQQASSLVKSKGGPQWLADKLEGLGAGAQARGVQMPPPLT